MSARFVDPIGGCGSDDRLVASPRDPAVQRHLDGCAECRVRELMLRQFASDAELPDGVSRGAGAAAEALVRFVSRPSRPGDARARHRELLGQGPRGLTFAEFEPRADRHVAVKELDSVDRDRLDLVASALARAAHPNLVPYVEIVDGPVAEVRRRLVEHDLAEAATGAGRARLVQWLAQIASALVTLHEAGVAHGGLCPENLRVQHGQIYVVDAGLGGLPPRSPWRADELADGTASAPGDWFALGRILSEHAPQLAEGPCRGPFDIPRLIERMCSADPDERPTGAEVLAALVLEGVPDGLDGTRFTARRYIDSGGMGEVLLVWDPVSRREVALKRVRAASATPSGLFRFVEEARIAGQLQHPNILPVYELGEDALGMPFFTMKPVFGESPNLSAVLRKVHAGEAPGWPLSRRLEVFLKLCDAVAYANGQGWLHLDLKPHNVLVGEFGEVYLVDWGLARRCPQAGAAPAEPGGFTAAYAPPEQRERGLAELGPWSDVFALGRTLREVVIGLGPATEPTVGTTMPDQPPRPAGALPPELEAIVDRATRPAPAERYPSAAALRADVERFLAGEPVSAHVYTARARFARWSRPYQGPTALAAVALLTLGALGGAVWRSVDEARRSRVAEARGASDLLVEQARAALSGGDRIEAERLAVSALAGATEAGLDSVTGRGLLARMGRAAPPSLAGACEERSGAVRCALPAGDVDWTPDEAGGPTVGFTEDHRLWLDRDGVRPVSDPLPTRVTKTWTCGSRAVMALADVRPAYAATARSELWVWTPDAAPAAIGPADPETVPRCDPRGRRLAVADDERVDVWQISPLRQETSIQGHSDAVRALAWSEDGKLLASASADHTVRLWDASAFQRLGPLHSQDAEVGRLPADAAVVGFTRAGGSTLLVVAGADGPPRGWDVSGGGTVGAVDLRVPAASIGWAGPALASCDRHGNLRWWDTATGAATAGPPIEGAAAFGVDPAGRSVAVVDGDGVVRAVDLPGGSVRWVVAGGARAVAWGRWVVAGGSDGFSVMDPADGTELGRGGIRNVVDVDVNGTLALVRTGDGTTRAIELPSGRLASTWTPGAWVAFDRTGMPRLVVQGRSLLAERGGVALGAQPRAVDLSPDDRLVAVATADRTVRLFRANDGAELARVAIDLGPNPMVSFSPDGAILAVAGRGSEVELWDVSAAERPVDTFVASLGRRYAGVDLGARSGGGR